MLSTLALNSTDGLGNVLGVIVNRTGELLKATGHQSDFVVTNRESVTVLRRINFVVTGSGIGMVTDFLAGFYQACRPGGSQR